MPIGYFICYLPIGLIAGALSAKGVPWIGLVSALFSIMVAVGDPLVFFFKKLKPELVSVDKPGFFNFRLIIFVINEPVPVETEGRPTAPVSVNKNKKDW